MAIYSWLTFKKSASLIAIYNYKISLYLKKKNTLITITQNATRNIYK